MKIEAKTTSNRVDEFLFNLKGDEVMRLLSFELLKGFKVYFKQRIQFFLPVT